MSDFFNKHEDQMGRGLTYDLWKGFPMHEILIMKDANVGLGCMLDPANPPHVAAATAATLGSSVRGFTDATAIVSGLTHAAYNGGHGMRLFTSANNEAAEVQWCGGGEPFVISDTAAHMRELIFEVQFRLDSITAEDVGFFIGLAGAAAMDGDFLADNVADKDAIADVDLIGLFHDHPATTALDVIYQITGTATTEHEAAWKTLATNTWYKFGMRYRPVSKKLDLYWGTGDLDTKLAIDDNPILSTDIAGADFPDGQGLAPTIAIKGGHADDVTLDIRAMACAQLAYAAD